MCKVHILSGEYHTQRMSRSCLSVEEEAEGIVLACKAFPDSDVTLRVIGKMCKAVDNVAA